MTEVAEAPVLSGRAVSPAPATTASATWYALDSGDVYWRIHSPAKEVGAEVRLMTAREANAEIFMPNRARKIPWYMTAVNPDGSVEIIDTAQKWAAFKRVARPLKHLWAEFPEHQGTAVFTRPCFGRAALARFMRGQGIRTVAETDDNLFADSKFNLGLREGSRGTSEFHEFQAKAFASMEANVFATEWLRDRYWREYRQRFGKRNLPEMHVCRNHVPSADWPERIERTGPLRVGFMGSNSHVWDINLAYGTFKLASDLGCETWMVGYHPGAAEDTPNSVTIDGKTISARSEKAQTNLDMWDAVVRKHTPWVHDSQEFRRQSLPLDIGLCPLLMNDFNNGKSDIKAVEYTVSGAAVVAMNLPVYNTAGWKHEVNCLLAGSPREMAEQTVRLIKDSKLRYELVTNAQQMVAEERNEHVLANEWKEALGL